jgi:hypothetical protein
LHGSLSRLVAPEGGWVGELDVEQPVPGTPPGIADDLARLPVPDNDHPADLFHPHRLPDV